MGTPARNLTERERAAIGSPAFQRRFWSHVHKSDAPDGCWTWTGETTGDGYGRIKLAGRKVVAHRISWEMHHGPIGDGLVICHDCPGGDNPACVRPDHLWEGSEEQNIRDMISKGRSIITNPVPVRGERHGARTHPERFCKLTADTVRAIRQQFDASEATVSALARRYGVAHNTIQAVVRRRTWQHVQ